MTTAPALAAHKAALKNAARHRLTTTIFRGYVAEMSLISRTMGLQAVIVLGHMLAGCESDLSGSYTGGLEIVGKGGFSKSTHREPSVTVEVKRTRNSVYQVQFERCVFSYDLSRETGGGLLTEGECDCPNTTDRLRLGGHDIRHKRDLLYFRVLAADTSHIGCRIIFRGKRLQGS